MSGCQVRVCHLPGCHLFVCGGFSCRRLHSLSCLPSSCVPLVCPHTVSCDTLKHAPVEWGRHSDVACGPRQEPPGPWGSVGVACWLEGFEVWRRVARAGRVAGAAAGAGTARGVRRGAELYTDGASTGAALEAEPGARQVLWAQPRLLRSADTWSGGCPMDS
jgi:hypothetical protein